MPIGQVPAIAVLDAIFNAGSYVGPPAVHVRMWTVMPSPDGSNGTECTGAMVRPILRSTPAAPGSAGKVAQVGSAQGVIFEEIDQPSSLVVALSVHDDDTGDLVWVGPFSPPSTKATGGWDAGDSPALSASTIVAAFTA